MSNIYIQEPTTSGKVVVSTTVGDFDIELWSKEAPKACRNFVQLCLESYYNDSIFHRVIPGFIAQGGDPTGTGTAGESIYGKPFKDEFHSRLRFVRRGLVAMANAGPDDNSSQFFFTLGATKELQNKHTVFGKITGDTIYNLPRFEEGIIGENERPENPHKITKTEVLKNPFTDIVPRIAITNEIPKSERKSKKGTKNFKLLSFGDEAEEDEEEFVTVTRKMTKANSAHDLAMDPTLSADVGQAEELPGALERIKEKLNVTSTEEKQEKTEEPNLPVDPQDANDSTDEKRRIEIKAEIRKLKRELQGKNSKEETEEENSPSKKPKLSSNVENFLNEKKKYELEKEKIPKKKTTRESQTLALLDRFINKIRSQPQEEEEGGGDKDQDRSENEDDDDESWLHHKILFDEVAPIMAKDASTKDDSWYELNDPRNPLTKRRRETSKTSKN